jgi:hypothetical protein
MRRFFLFVPFAILAAACSEAKPTDRRPLGATPATPAMQASASGDVLTGTVLEQIAAPPYLYLRLKTANGDVWAAVNQATLTIGAPVTVYGAILMEKFQSKTLNRTFDRIYFGSLDAPSGPPPATAMGEAAPPTSVGTPPAVDAHVPKVDKASGGDARTISEAWAQKDKLTGATVSIRGVVVKYNEGVMGKNWIHLQDGSGDAAKGTHDITVTSMDVAVIGATITITGKVQVNKDFGAGYMYPLIIEDAKVSAK